MDFENTAREIIDAYSEVTSIGRERAIAHVAGVLQDIYRSGQIEMRERAAAAAWRVTDRDVYAKTLGLEKKCAAEIRHLAVL